MNRVEGSFDGNVAGRWATSLKAMAATSDEDGVRTNSVFKGHATGTLTLSHDGTYSWNGVRNQRVRLYVPGECFFSAGKHYYRTFPAVTDGSGDWYWLRYYPDDGIVYVYDVTLDMSTGTLTKE